MKFLDGYIIATIITGLMSLGNRLWEWQLGLHYIIAPVVLYLFFSIMVLFYKQTKRKE